MNTLPPWLTVADWAITANADAPDGAHLASLFATANGYLGVRGDRLLGGGIPGTYLNGLYEEWDLRYAEEMYGLARAGQSRIAAPGLSGFEITLDQRPLADLPVTGEHRRLDYRTGTYTHELSAELPSGAMVKLTGTRLASLTHRHLMEQTLLVETSKPVQVEVAVSVGYAELEDPTNDGIDPRVGRLFGEESAPVVYAEATENLEQVRRTVRSQQTVAIAARVAAEGVHQRLVLPRPTQVVTATVDPSQGAWRVEATAALSFSTDPAVPLAQARAELAGQIGEPQGVLARLQQEWLDDYWRDADLSVIGPDGVTAAMRYGSFAIAQASAQLQAESISAKGMTAAGYEGHYFWDTEVFFAPMLSLVRPELAKETLLFRHRTLPQARDWARALHCAGALFPWRTIDGREASGYYPAGTAQKHINADIAYAVCRYVNATDDLEFLFQYGTELLIETARMWVSVGTWTHRRTIFEIHRVTGPDEYTALVDNNLYTNVMARFNLRQAARAVRQMQLDAPSQWADLKDRIDWDAGEYEEWLDCADAMKVEVDEELGVHPQDDSFLDLKPLDHHDPRYQRPFLLHYHPLFIYRHQILKQADVVMATNMLPEDFTRAQRVANFDFYDPLTTGDSSLSCVGQGIGAARAGHCDLGLLHFTAAAMVDLADTHHNTKDGLHLAAAAGAWSIAVMGFAGVQIQERGLVIEPCLPLSWDAITIPLRWRGARLVLTVTRDSVRVRNTAGPVVTVVGPDQVSMTVSEGQQVELGPVGDLGSTGLGSGGLGSGGLGSGELGSGELGLGGDAALQAQPSDVPAERRS